MINELNINDKSKLIFEYNDLQIEYNKEKEESFVEYASSKYGVPKENIVFKFIPISYDSNGNRVTLNSDIIENIQDPRFQFSLFKEFIELKKIEDVDIDEIGKIDNEVNSYVDFDAYKNYKTYKIKSIKWDNFLSYGKDNYFDFTKLNGLVLLNGFPENQCGKTTFAIDLIRFALFGKSDKAPTLDLVFNEYLTKETEVNVEVCIEVDGSDYVIKRKITRPAENKRTCKSKASQTVEYYKIINGNANLIENCQDENVTKTNKLIRESIGTIDDFNLVMLATSYSLNELLRLGQTEKSKIFSKWLGLLSLEKKEEIAKKLYKEKIVPSFKTQNYNSERLIQEIEEIEEKINDSNKKIDEKNSEELKCKENIKNMESEKSKLLSSKREINPEFEKIDANTIKMKIQSFTDELKKARAEFSSLKEKYIKELKFVSFNKDEMNKKRIIRDGLKDEINKIKYEINDLKNKNNELSSLISNGVCPKCKQKINEKSFNDEIEKNNTLIEKKINDGKNFSKKLKDVELSISELENNRELNELKNKYELKMTAIKANIDNFKLKIANEEEKKSKIESNIENIKYNNEINIEVSNLDARIHNETIIKESIIKDLQILKNNIVTFNNKISENEKILDEIDKENKIKRNWSIYSLLIGKDGISKIVLNKALPIINNELKRLLDGICDFGVSLEVNNGKLLMFLEHNSKKLDLATRSSGFESTMASLALRAALGNMATMPKPNFIVFDEIINTVGNENLDNIHKLFRRILSNYDFIIHITHLEQIYEWHDKIVTVTKDGDISKIKM